MSFQNLRPGEIFLDKPLFQTLKKRIEPYNFEVGVINDRPHYSAKSKTLKGYAGGPARRQSNKTNCTMGDVSKDVRKFLGFNYLTRPFEKKNANINQFMNWFFKSIFASGKLTEKRRGENLLQAVVRNPILKQEYGRNSRYWARVKGFNRKLIDTGQFFRSIEGRIRRARVSR